MAKIKYVLNDFQIGDLVFFSRTGIDDFRMQWKVIGFFENMIQVEINEMGYKDKLYIDVKDVENLLKSSQENK